MALTPDDLLNKEFPETKFRPGYDKDEVDDFLDEVVVEWRRLAQENEELTAKVAALEEQLEENPANLEPDELKDAGLSGYAGTTSTMTGSADPSTEEHELSADSSVTAHPEYALGTRPAQERPVAAEPAASDQATSATGVLAMAQQLHDQYVSEGEQTRAAYIAEGEARRTEYITEGEQTRSAYIAEGETTRDAYIAEGETRRDELVSTAEATHAQLLAEAERRRNEIVTEAETRAENVIEEAELTSTRTLNALERKKADLESKVGELTSFERDYRARLRDYIEGQLADLNSRGSIEKEATVN
ncbi:DivIVA domain-containing protein [Nesterenkonia sp. LB17]|uniref:DivIVA domain-containing protein n=1 Tax=unclassified Nesterenkonia TaxID=2629769 RepID=UPI001F4CA9E2|nr:MULTISPECIES: DivIVA domain-containing protein [unclassified Nesterenkonia]MCH8559519.1 DivIVA domain-containing protein [Nesterenkonia sp. DZ6]MCH8561696.1 DivIVA domain-containing protein [Nesterenkonia sp. YGD6]MCH8564789.1 DivIVA domain-containing protein [Nesterenkonia sp. LB17]MCH8570405.1 DivIVA domain-containing protein [Nesterenkonia sp. AY15]